MNPLHVIEAVLLALICVISFIGNLCLFIIVYTGRRDLRTISNTFLLNLALADLIVTVINMPITVVTILIDKQWFSHNACVGLGFTNIISFIGSVMSLALMAINRYFFIVHWKEYSSIFNRKNACLSIIILWVITIVISTPPLIGWSRYSYIPGKSYCFVDWRADAYYMYFMLGICFFGPLTTMIFCYTKILRFTGRVKRNLVGTEQEIKQAFVNTNNPHLRLLKSRVSSEEAKLTNTLLIVVSAFLISWSPFAITMFFDVYAETALPRVVDMGSLLFGYLNSMCNPIIYAARCNRFKKGYITLFFKCFRCVKRERVTIIPPRDALSNNDNTGNSASENSCKTASKIKAYFPRKSLSS